MCFDEPDSESSNNLYSESNNVKIDVGDYSKKGGAQVKEFLKLIPKDIEPRLPFGQNPKPLSTRATTADISEIRSEGKSKVIKQIRRQSRILAGLPKYESVAKQEYIKNLEERIKTLQEETNFMQEVFGDMVVPIQFLITESSELGSDGLVIPTITIVQDKVDGESILWGQKDTSEVWFDYEYNAGQSESTAQLTDPNYQKTISQLQHIVSVLEDIARGDYSKLSPNARKFLQDHPEQISFAQGGWKKGFKILPFDIHRLGNVLVDKNGNVRIIDW